MIYKDIQMEQQFAREDFCSYLERSKFDHWSIILGHFFILWKYCMKFMQWTPQSTQSGNGRFLHGVHSIMMEKLAQAGEEGGGARPPLFTLFTITYKVAVLRSSWESRYNTLPLFHLYPYMYSVVSTGRKLISLIFFQKVGFRMWTARSSPAYQMLL